MNRIKGLYICKCYRIIDNKLQPVLKYGKTNNINTRMYFYNKNGLAYKLIAFFPCKDFIDERENLIHQNYEAYRITRSEHILYEKGEFNQLYDIVKEASEVTIKKLYNKERKLIGFSIQ
jgi:hypothetical protein